MASLSGDREVEALLLRAVAQGGVVDVQLAHRRSRLGSLASVSAMVPVAPGHLAGGPGAHRAPFGLPGFFSSRCAVPHGAGCAPATKKPPGFGRFARRGVPVALVENEGGGGHVGPGGLHGRQPATGCPDCEPPSRDVGGCRRHLPCVSPPACARPRRAPRTGARPDPSRGATARPAGTARPGPRSPPACRRRTRPRRVAGMGQHRLVVVAGDDRRASAQQPRQPRARHGAHRVRAVDAGRRASAVVPDPVGQVLLQRRRRPAPP